jgi:hypothetical protein
MCAPSVVYFIKPICNVCTTDCIIHQFELLNNNSFDLYILSGTQTERAYVRISSILPLYVATTVGRRGLLEHILYIYIYIYMYIHTHKYTYNRLYKQLYQPVSPCTRIFRMKRLTNARQWQHTKCRNNRRLKGCRH